MPRDSYLLERASRAVQANICPTKKQRDNLVRMARECVGKKNLVGPVSLSHLQQICDEIISRERISPEYKDFLAVIVNNEIWRDSVAAVPYKNRLLLLPKCLRDSENCKGHFDSIGLICAHCGNCLIDRIKSEAEKLGYAVLIAEGSPIVMSLIKTGKIEAIIGAGCLSVLEQSFTYMEAAAIPGIALPLLYDGCIDTHIDVDWLLNAIYDSRNERSKRFDISQTCQKTRELFTEANLRPLLLMKSDTTQEIALDWMLRAGKRWRPAMLVCTYAALADDGDSALSENLVRAAAAVECFHKASLIHDDIADQDRMRYGMQTLHAQYNVAIALNVGDFLLGEGYRLIAELGIDDSIKGLMIEAAAGGHRELCLGQGRELFWTWKRGILKVEDVLSIFEKKTAPAFEVALKLGALLAGRPKQFDDVFRNYSKYLGIAYQIQDDIDDFDNARDDNDFMRKRPSIMIALAFEKASSQQHGILEKFWTCQTVDQQLWEKVKTIVAATGAKGTALDMLGLYKYKTVDAIAQLSEESLKGFLRIIVSKVFHEIEIMLCCDDNPKRND